MKKKQTESIDAQISVATDKETIESLRNEIDYLKSKNQQMLLMMRKNEAEGKGAAMNAMNGIMGGMNGGKGEEGKEGELDVSSQDILTKNKYLRSLFFNYLCSRDRSARNHMQTALMTIFQFTPEEVMEIRKKASSSWF